MPAIALAAVIVSAVAIVLQALLLFAIYRQTRIIGEQVSTLAPKLESTLESTQRTLEQSRRQIAEVTTKASQVLDTAQAQLMRVDQVLEDATTRARAQLDHIEMVLDDTISRVHQTVTALHNAVLLPLKEVSGVAVGIRAAVAYLLKGGRPNVAQATQDDEMFI
jgi:predicted PurR-regulated permease PerM